MANEWGPQTEMSRTREIRRILRLLETTARIIESSAITDQFSEGEERCARQFNNALTHLIELEAVPETLFEPLPTDAAFGDICFACHQVAAYLRECAPEDFVDFTHIKKTIGDELKDVSEVVKNSMPDFLKDVWSGPAKPDAPDAPESVEIVSDDDDDVENSAADERIAKLEGQMETVVEILQEIRTQQAKQDSDL